MNVIPNQYSLDISYGSYWYVDWTLKSIGLKYTHLVLKDNLDVPFLWWILRYVGSETVCVTPQLIKTRLGSNRINN